MPVTPGNQLPTLSVLAGFGATGGAITYTDITAYVRSGTIDRSVTQLAGPLYQYQPATATIVLKNDDGRFDPDDLTGPYTSSSGLQTVTKLFTTAGASSWTAPSNLASATIKVECVAGGGSGYSPVVTGTGNGAGAGGGGEWASEPNLAVTPGVSYAYTVGAGGVQNGTGGGAGSAGGNTTFAGDSVTVTANGGAAAPVGGTGVGGAGGTGSANTTHHNGGAGGTNTHFGTDGFNGGCGGGASGGSAATGTAGSNTSSNAGANGGAAVTGGGPGGRGGGTGEHGTSGVRPTSGPGGGGGGGWANYNTYTHGGNGYQGQIRITYTISTPGGATVTQVIPVVPVQIQATWNSVTYSLFTGYATSWADAGINNPRYAEVTLSATDGMYVLQGIQLAPVSIQGAGEDTGTRVGRVLDSAGWPGDQRTVDEGDSALQGTTYGDTALNLIQAATDTEAGEFYIDGSGNAVFRHRTGIITDTRSTTVQMVLGDSPGTVETDGTELPYAATGRVIDDSGLFNDVQATRVGGALQEAMDAPSVSQYLFPRSYARSDLLHTSDAETLQWAQYILRIAATVGSRFNTVTLMPQRDPTDLYPQALGREIGDLVEVWRRPPGVTAFSKQCFIRGISHAWDFSAHTWTTQWTLQNNDRYSFLILDDTTLGRLDFNALGY